MAEKLSDGVYRRELQRMQEELVDGRAP